MSDTNITPQGWLTTRTWLEVTLVTAPPQDFMVPRGPRPGRTALATMTATRRGSPGRCSWEASRLILTRVSITFLSV